MDTPYDLRKEDNRVSLAAHLPIIDNIKFDISSDEFINTLSVLADLLEDPDWMIYQCGACRPIPCGDTKLMLTLSDVIELGIHLSNLTEFDNFDEFLKGFFNPPQFADSRFEAKVAYTFSQLPSTKVIRFSPTYTIRKRTRKPDFDAHTVFGVISVECKRPHINIQQSVQRFQSVASEFRKAMDQLSWPTNLRLEIEITDQFRELASSIAQRLVKNAINEAKNNECISLIDGPITAFVVPRDSSFQISDGRLEIGVMVLDSHVPTRIANPEFTALRVISNRLDKQIAKSVGALVNEALKQLPESNDCIIFISDVPFRIALKVFERRMNGPTYGHVRAFVVWADTGSNLVYREQDEGFVINILEDAKSHTRK